MASLKLINVNKVYPSGETALYDVNLEADDREFLVIVGADGSGKSSLLRVVAGLEDATSGSVLIDEKDMVDVEPKNRDLAMVFQSSTLYPSLNVFDNMAYGLRLRKAPEALVKERVKVVSGILGLDEYLYKKPKVLTAAVKQRVAIARAVVREPKLYLFDEPLSGLDEKLRAEMLSVILNLQVRLEGTFVYATKNLSEALTIGTRLVVLKEGFVQQIDTPANLYDYPANTYVAFYIGSPTVNFIKKARVEAEDGKYTVSFAGGKLELAEKTVNRFEKISDYVSSGAYVTLGIRPEDASIQSDGSLSGAVSDIACNADGNAEYAEVEIAPDICLKVRAGENAVKGERVNISVDAEKLLIFDAATCLTLLNRDAGYAETGKKDAAFVPLPYGEEQKMHESLKPKGKAKKK